MDRPGPQMIPVRFLTEPERLVYEEVPGCVFDQPTFDRALDAWRDAGHSSEQHEQSLEQLLDAPDPEAAEALRPALFIFHMSRCGSTLMARSLAQSPGHFVISEASVINDMLWHLCEGDLNNLRMTDQKQQLFQKLIRALFRKQSEEAQHGIIKYSSWNVRLLPFIRQAFPDVPMVFLYRQPEEVMVSCLKQPPSFLADRGSDFSQTLTGWSAQRIQSTSEIDYLAHCLRRMIQSALAEDLYLLDYADLTATHLPVLLSHFGIQASDAELDTMQALFATDSKRDCPFEDDRQAKQAAATPEIREAAQRHLHYAMHRLQSSPLNLRTLLHLRPLTTHAG